MILVQSSSWTRSAGINSGSAPPCSLHCSAVFLRLSTFLPVMAFEFQSKPSACPVPAVENFLVFHRPTSVEVQTFENEVYLVGLRSRYD